MSKVQSMLNDSLKNGKSIKWANIMIERMQLAVATSAVFVTKMVERAVKELKAAKERETQARKLGVALASDYSKVAKIYNEELKDANVDQLALDIYASKSIERVIKYATEPQLKVITEYCQMKAKHSVKEIENIGKFLADRGVLKPAEPKQETAKEKKARLKAEKAAAKLAANNVVL